MEHCQNSRAAARDPSMALITPHYVHLESYFHFSTTDENIFCQFDNISAFVNCTGNWNLLDTISFTIHVKVDADKMPLTSRDYLAETLYCVEYRQFIRNELSSIYSDEYQFFEKCDSVSISIFRSPQGCDDVVDLSTFEECQIRTSSDMFIKRSGLTAFFTNLQPGWLSNSWGGVQYMKIGLKAEYKITGIRIRAEDNVNCFFIKVSFEGTLWSLFEDKLGHSVFCANQSELVDVDGLSAHYFKFTDLQTRYIGMESINFRLSKLYLVCYIPEHKY